MEGVQTLQGTGQVLALVSALVTILVTCKAVVDEWVDQAAVSAAGPPVAWVPSSQAAAQVGRAAVAAAKLGSCLAASRASLLKHCTCCRLAAC